MLYNILNAYYGLTYFLLLELKHFQLKFVHINCLINSKAHSNCQRKIKRCIYPFVERNPVIQIIHNILWSENTVNLMPLLMCNWNLIKAIWSAKNYAIYRSIV